MKKYLGILISLIGVFIVGIFCADTVKGWFDKPEDPTNEEENGKAESDFTFGDINEQGIKLSVMTVATSTVTVSATITPADTPFDKLVWSLEWKNEIDEKFNMDYISMEISEDTHSCSVYDDMPFTETILLKCSSERNPEVYATVDLEYIGKYVSTAQNELTLEVPETYSFSTITVGDLFDLVGFNDTFVNSQSYGGTISGEAKLGNLISITHWKYDWTEEIWSEDGQSVTEIYVYGWFDCQKTDLVKDVLEKMVTESADPACKTLEEAYNIFSEHGLCFTYEPIVTYEDKDVTDFNTGTIDFYFYFDLSNIIEPASLQMSNTSIKF